MFVNRYYLSHIQSIYMYLSLQQQRKTNIIKLYLKENFKLNIEFSIQVMIIRGIHSEDKFY